MSPHPNVQILNPTYLQTKERNFLSRFFCTTENFILVNPLTKQKNQFRQKTYYIQFTQLI